MTDLILQALDNFEHSGEDAEAMNMAIDCAVKSKDMELSQRLVDFLIGDLDGIPKVNKNNCPAQQFSS